MWHCTGQSYLKIGKSDERERFPIAAEHLLRVPEASHSPRLSLHEPTKSPFKLQSVQVLFLTLVIKSLDQHSTGALLSFYS